MIYFVEQENLTSYSKKQSRIISDTRNKSDETINDYLTKFLLGIEIKKERGGE